MIFRKWNSLNRFDQLLYLFIAFITAMIAVRVAYTESLLHVYLIWNIFLAWLPYHFSKRFHNLQFKKRWKQYLIFCAWLLFFPNALYLITDLIHINDSTQAPEWYDALLLFSAAFVGVVMAYLSLRRVHLFLQFKFSTKAVSFLIPVIVFISSFGVYLGRFQRWNSWDIIQSPLLLLKDVIFTIIHPMVHYKAWAFSLLFAIAIMLMYSFLNAAKEKV